MAAGVRSHEATGCSCSSLSRGRPTGSILDPVRIQEGLFLFSRRPDSPPESEYAFEPGIYGPISDELDSDLGRLADDGWIELVPVRGAHWSLHKPTGPLPAADVGRALAAFVY